MFTQPHELSVVTAVLPNTVAEHVIEVLHAKSHRAMLVWSARGTTVRDRWYARWLPPISPAKVMLQLVVPKAEVDAVLATIVTEGRLHMQATGPYSPRAARVPIAATALLAPATNSTAFTAKGRPPPKACGTICAC